MNKQPKSKVLNANSLVQDTSYFLETLEERDAHGIFPPVQTMLSRPDSYSLWLAASSNPFEL